jgi:transcriptional regulator with XRE-family HTH domain
VLLRRWRQNRRLSQEALALAAGSSTRHLSCLETGRSQPSREMILRLAEQLEIPLRDQNALLLAAGFAPAFQERSLAELENARQAIEQILEAHKPYPAFALDRHWNVVATNSALPQLYEGCSPELLRKPINALRLVLHPEGMGPRIGTGAPSCCQISARRTRSFHCTACSIGCQTRRSIRNIRTL